MDPKTAQAGDDAVGADDDRGAPADQAQGNPYGLTDEEAKAFEEMRTGSGPDAQIAQDGEGEQDADAGLTSRDVNADAAAAAASLEKKPTEGAAEGDPVQQQQAAAAEGDDDDDADPTDGGKHPQRVNYHKFRRAREERDKARTELQAEREQRQRLDERYKMIVEALQVGDKQAAKPGEAAAADPNELGPMPDPKEDIFAFAEWQARKIAQMENRINGTETRVQQADTEQQRTSAYASDVREFVGKNPDWQHAYDFLMATRVVELGAQMGLDIIGGDQPSAEQLSKIEKTVLAEERQLRDIAFENRQSPAKQVYLMAKARGYRAAPVQQQNGGAAPAAAAAAAANGAAKPAANGGGKPTVSDAVRAAKNGVATNATLSSGGGAPETTLTANQVAAMSQEEFAAFMETASPDQMRAVLGA